MASSEEILRAHLREVPFHRVLIRSIEARILSEVFFPSPVLDVGCGDGHFASVLFAKRAEVGLDPGFAEAAESAARGAYRFVITASAADLPFPDRSFGSAISNCVFEHILELEKTLSEIRRVLKPGGIFACTVISDRFSDLLIPVSAWSRLGLGRLRQAYVDWFNRKARHYHFDPPARWRQRIEAAGFQLRRWRYYLSPEATRILHRDHYLSLPHLLSRRLTGRWVPFPRAVDRPYWIRRYLKYVEEPEPSPGACIAFVCARPPEK